MTYLELADRNYNLAKRCMLTFNDEGDFGLLSFHVQQAFELYLKAEIDKCGIVPKHTHQLLVLLADVEKLRPLSVDELELRKIAPMVTTWESMTRYPPAMLTARNELVLGINTYERLRRIGADDERLQQALDTLSSIGYNIPREFVQRFNGDPLRLLPEIISAWEREH